MTSTTSVTCRKRRSGRLRKEKVGSGRTGSDRDFDAASIGAYCPALEHGPTEGFSRVSGGREGTVSDEIDGVSTSI
jgi:hypothetical protein